jgi:hypothetical protein
MRCRPSISGYASATCRKWICSRSRSPFRATGLSGPKRALPHGATAAEIDFLKTRRVELNAITSLQLVDLIKRKLAEHGVKKVIPDAAVMEQHARHWLELELADRALKRAIPQVKKQLAAIKLPPDLRQLVEAELQREPSLSWDIAVTNVLPPLPQGRRRRKAAE